MFFCVDVLTGLIVGALALLYLWWYYHHGMDKDDRNINIYILHDSNKDDEDSPNKSKK